MSNGLVSIIIPTFNRAAIVLDAIRSAQAQTYTRKQIIVVDDGSGDDTASRVRQLGGVEYYYQAHKGQGAARNFGLRNARGEFVATLDSDDLWQPDFLAGSVQFLEQNKLDFVFSNWLRYDNGV